MIYLKKIKVLEVNNIDLIGNRFNGYDMIEEISDKDIEIKQAVLVKQSDNENVINIINSNSKQECINKFDAFEVNNSIKNVLSITTPSLMNLKEYKEADIIHFHMFHNTKLSLYSIRKIAEEKKVVLEASSEEELIEKIKNVDWNKVSGTNVGVRFDFSV